MAVDAGALAVRVAAPARDEAGDADSSSPTGFSIKQKIVDAALTIFCVTDRVHLTR